MGLMDALSGWLKQIIAVILLATLIDLLLPNRTMQRYVRLVAGLFVLMTVATPIMNWIKGDFDAKLAAGLQSVERMPEGAGAQLAMIEAEGAKLRDGHRLEAERLVAAKLAEEIKREVELDGKRSVREATVELERKPDGSLSVAKAVVELRQPGASAEDGRTGAEPVPDVEAIADVEIAIGDIGGNGSGTDGGAIPAGAREAAEDGAAASEKAAVAALVAARLGIPAGVVEVRLPSAPEAERK